MKRDRPRWQHSDGRPYDDLDFGHTRFADEADAARRPSRLRALLRRLWRGRRSRS